MLSFFVPDCLATLPQIVAGEISFIYYHQNGSQEKNKVIFNQHAISFVLNGQKEVYRARENTIINSGQGMLIPIGNSIMAEHNLNNNEYSSLLVFFPGEFAINFLSKHASLVVTDNKSAAPEFILFSNTGYLRECLKGLLTLVKQGSEISFALALHKLEELLLVIFELFPKQLIAMFNNTLPVNQLSLKKIVENNLYNNLKIEELAFLANRSVSSFKRDFEKAYHVSPQKYIRDRKLEAACTELIKGRLATEIHQSYGYENLSNFNTAFKKKFGVTPTDYRRTYNS